MAPKAGPAVAAQSKSARFGVALVVAGAVGYFAWSGLGDSEASNEAALTFVEVLNRGDVTGAYALLSSRRRAQLPEPAFDRLTQHPAFRGHSGMTIGHIESRPEGRCLLGSVSVDGGEWAMQLYVIEEGSGHRVHSFALQPPADPQLGTLLPECGYWEGTRVGYSGPAVERATRPTDS